MLAANIYDYIRAKGKTLGIGPSPFSVEGQMARAKKNGPDPLQTTLMARVGGLGNGGGKLTTAIQQGRGIASATARR